jgi:hypothetical protein
MSFLHRFVYSALSGVLLLLPLATVVDAARIGFVVSELPHEIVHGDSYVVTIDESDTTRLAQARLLVAWIESGANWDNAPDGRIVFTSIAPGADGINRNVLAQGEPLWDWHPVGEVSFVDISAEIYDGWPTFINDDVPGWMANTNGGVGLWGYTITQELGVVPEPSAAIPSAAGLLWIACRMRRKA